MIQAVGPGDAALLADLHRQGFERPWSEGEIAKLLENAAVFAFLSTAEGRPQGFVMAWVVADEAEILTVAVASAARRKGVGAALVTAAGVAALVRGAASMHLEVAEDNAAARSLYRKLGYEESGRRRGYYSGGDAILMRRILPRPVL